MQGVSLNLWVLWFINVRLSTECIAGRLHRVSLMEAQAKSNDFRLYLFSIGGVSTELARLLHAAINQLGFGLRNQHIRRDSPPN